MARWGLGFLRGQRHIPRKIDPNNLAAQNYLERAETKLCILHIIPLL